MPIESCIFCLSTYLWVYTDAADLLELSHYCTLKLCCSPVVKKSIDVTALRPIFDVNNVLNNEPGQVFL